MLLQEELPGQEAASNSEVKKEYSKFLAALVGPPLSGKSTLGIFLERVSNAHYLDVDKIRQQLFPGDSILPQNKEMEAMVASYQHNHDQATELLKKGQPVILGATYSREYYHQKLKELAEKAEAPLVVFYLKVRDEDIEDRLAKRREGGSLSNITTIEAFRSIKDRYKLIDGVEVVEIDTSESLQENLDLIFKILKRFEKPTRTL